MGVQILLEKGSDIEAKDAKDRTPLSRAAGCNSQDVRYLWAITCHPYMPPIHATSTCYPYMLHMHATCA